MRTRWTALALLLILSACNLPASPLPSLTESPPPISTSPSPASTLPPAPSASETSLPAASAVPTLPLSPSPTASLAASPTSPLQEESLLILSPGPGSRLLSPVTISGVAGPTFESAIVVRVLDASGAVLALEPVQIQAEMGQRGNYSTQLRVEVTETTQVFIQVYSSSPRDGGLVHLNSIGVSVGPPGSWQQIKTAPTHLERLVIIAPMQGETVSGGLARVTGFGVASFEQTLVVEVQDAKGQVVGSQPLIVDSPELGEPGAFETEVAYTVAQPGPGRIVVRDPSAAFDGDVHLSSVEVELEP